MARHGVARHGAELGCPAGSGGSHPSQPTQQVPDLLVPPQLWPAVTGARGGATSMPMNHSARSQRALPCQNHPDPKPPRPPQLSPAGSQRGTGTARQRQLDLATSGSPASLNTCGLPTPQPQCRPMEPGPWLLVPTRAAPRSRMLTPPMSAGGTWPQAAARRDSAGRGGLCLPGPHLPWDTPPSPFPSPVQGQRVPEHLGPGTARGCAHPQL